MHIEQKIFLKKKVFGNPYWLSSFKAVLGLNVSTEKHVRFRHKYGALFLHFETCTDISVKNVFLQFLHEFYQQGHALRIELWNLLSIYDWVVESAISWKAESSKLIYITNYIYDLLNINAVTWSNKDFFTATEISNFLMLAKYHISSSHFNSSSLSKRS